MEKESKMKCGKCKNIPSVIAINVFILAEGVFNLTAKEKILRQRNVNKKGQNG